MVPTLHDGQICWINKLAYLRHGPRRGDVVALWTGKDLMVKRVVGLPGEEVAAQGGRFYVNGCLLTEDYVALHDHWDIASGKMAANHFAVAGDNRSQTLVAVIARERIVGRLVL